MRAIAESIKRLYQSKRLTLAQIKERVAKNTISKEEYKEITGKNYVQ